MSSHPSSSSHEHTPLLRDEEDQQNISTSTAKQTHAESRRLILITIIATLSSVAVLFLLGKATVNLVQSHKPHGSDVDFSKVGSEIEQLMKKWGVQGSAIGVVHKGKLIYSDAFGVRNSKGDPVTTKTSFQIGSTSKAFTSFSVAQLVDQGKLSWTKPISSYYMNLFKDPVATKEANLLDIMSHRTGLPRHDALEYFYSNDTILLSKMQYAEPTYQFREKWQYSNHMFTAAGRIAGKAAGTTWEDLIETKIMEPLGMTDSFASSHEFCSSNGDISKGFVTSRSGTPLEVSFEACAAMDVGAPSGSIGSSVPDMARWMTLLMNRGKLPNGTALVSEENFKMMLTPHMAEGSFEIPAAYGLGWRILPNRGKSTWTHGGATIGFATNLVLFPEDDFGFIIFGNTQGAAGYTYIMASMEILISRTLFPKDHHFNKVDYVKIADDKLRLGMQLAAENERRIIEAREKDSKPKAPLTSYGKVFSHRAYGNVHVSTPVMNSSGNLTAKILWTTEERELSATIEHWEHDTFALFGYSQLDFYASDGPLPIIYLEFVVSESGLVNEMRVKGFVPEFDISFVPSKDNMAVMGMGEFDERWSGAEKLESVFNSAHRVFQ
ncbi:hypothetical protein HDU76_000569 [Blyttiomyces sp. JEL0837]|nr:hypothetical protein HDU76_000569 [Blyttiomyces sp. JEL0837]